MQESREQVEVLLPPAPLDAQVVCAIVRRVGHAASAAALRSSVQANPYGCLNVVCDGSVSAAGQPLPPLFLTGPFSAPVETRAAGALRSTSVVIQPWVLPHLTGRPTVELVDQFLPLDPSRDAGLQDVVGAARRLAGERTAADAFWRALAAWLPSGPGLAEPPLALAVLRARGVRAAAAECGLGERQYRRRFEQAMGLRPGAWVRIARLENVLQGMSAQDAPSLSALAIDTGYADQAHMSREARALLRQSPSALQRTLRGQEEAPWPLRAVRPIYSRRRRRP